MLATGLLGDATGGDFARFLIVKIIWAERAAAHFIVVWLWLFRVFGAHDLIQLLVKEVTLSSDL